MQQATWNQVRYLSLMSWAVLSSTITSALLVLVFLPFDSLGRLLLGWPIGLAFSVNAVLLIAAFTAKRDQYVRVSVSEEGIHYEDEDSAYRRQALLPAGEIKSVRIWRSPLFKSLIIEMNEHNQRFVLTNASIPEAFLTQARALVNTTLITNN